MKLLLISSPAKNIANALKKAAIEVPAAIRNKIAELGKAIAELEKVIVQYHGDSKDATPVRILQDMRKSVKEMDEFVHWKHLAPPESIGKEAKENVSPTPEPAIPEPAAAEPAPEEKDKDTLLQEHVKTNADKYKAAFEALFPKTQMVVTNVEYRGAVTKDKIRVLVDFQAPLINFDALQVLADKEIGVEATGEKTFKVYNIFLPKVKDSAIK